MKQSPIFTYLCPCAFRLTLLVVGMASACFCSQGPRIDNVDKNGGTIDFDYASNLGWYNNNLHVGGVRDLAKIAFFYKIAAGGGNAQAMFLLGDSYAYGKGVPTNDVEAVRWYRLAAEKGDHNGMLRLGECYARGKGIQKDEIEAAKWYLKAARLGNVEDMCMYGIPTKQENGEVCAPKIEWLIKAANAGSALAMLNLGICYANGTGVEKNQAAAFKWHLKASENGDERAMVNLAYYYEHGLGIEKNVEESFTWLKRAADKDVVVAIRCVGLAYAVEQGVPQNDFLAYTWLSLAAAKGASDGMELRDEVRMRLSPEMVAKAQLLAKDWFENGTAQEERTSLPKKSDPGTDMPTGSGTGFFVTADGYLLTAAHVIAGASVLKVSIARKTLPVRVIRVDENNDIAMLKVEGEFSALLVMPSGSVKLGSDVFTIGFPNIDLQGASPKLTKGVISGLNGIQDDPSCFQVSVAVQPGNSGGPLVNSSGAVVGVVTARLNDLATAKQTGMLPQNVNYAVKSAYVLPLLDAIPESSSKPKPAANTTFDRAVSLADRAVCMVCRMAVKEWNNPPALFKASLEKSVHRLWIAKFTR